MNADAKTYKYFAFISYSRKDSKVAAWLQKRLEWFRFPVKLVPEDRRPPDPKYVRPVYRDKTNLEVTNEHYWMNIRRALEESRFLIVLCSPNSAKSLPVNMEVTHFLKVHGGDTSCVVPVIVGGNVIGTSEDAALCPALRDLRDPDDKPITDRNLPTMVHDMEIAEKDAWESGFVALSSYLLQLERSAIGNHLQREARRRAQSLSIWLASVVLLAALAIFASWMTVRQLEFTRLEEGRAWLERARAAKSEKENLKALMFAARSVGFFGYGRKENEPTEIQKAYSPLLGRAFKDAEAEKQRLEEVRAVKRFVDTVSPTCLPIWSSSMPVYHFDAVKSVAFSPDCCHFASGSSDKTVKLWDVVTGKQLAILRHSEPVTSVAFSPDGTRLASGAQDHSVKLWETASGKELATFQGHSSWVSSVTFSPDGTRLASGAQDNLVKLWDAASGKELAIFRHSESVTSVAFSPDGTRLASGAQDNSVKLWEVVSGKQLAILRHSEPVTSVAFSPDGTRLASGAHDSSVRLWEVASGKQLAILRHSEPITSVAFSPDGTRLASGAQDNSVKLWETASGKELAIFQGHSSGVSSVAFSPDGTRLASGSEDHTVKLWDAANRNELATLRGHSSIVNSVDFSPDRKLLASGAEDNTVKLWDVASGQEIATFQGYSEIVTKVFFSPNGARLASLAADKTIIVWDVPSGKEIAKLQAEDCIFSNHEIKWDKASSKWSDKKFDLSIHSFMQGRDCKINAIPDGKLIRLVACDVSLDLLSMDREGYLYIGEREIVWKTNNTPLTMRIFAPIYWKPDLVAQLAVAENPADAFTLRLRLCGQGGQWRALLALWEQIKKAGLDTDTQVRLEFTVQSTIALRGLAQQTPPQAPAALWKALLEACQKAHWQEHRFTLPLAQALPIVLTVSPDLNQLIISKIFTLAEKSWLDAVKGEIAKKQK